MDKRDITKTMRVIVLALAIQLPLPVLADAAAFNNGIAALKANDNAAAARYFEQARLAGVDSASLHYNLGVAYYRLKRYPEAEAAFARVARSPDTSALAHYNLGLVAVAEGDTRKAERLFGQVLAETQPEAGTGSESARLRPLAARQLGKLREPAPDGGSGFIDSLGGIVSGELGYDDNVTLQADDLGLTTGTDDTYLSLFLYGDGSIVPGRRHGVRVEGSLYTTNYNELTAFNQDDLEAGVVLMETAGAWKVDAGAHLGYTSLDGNGFTRAGMLRLQGSRALSAKQQLRLRYEFRRIDELDGRYRYLAGWRQQLRADSTWNDNGKKLRLTYRLELNDREDLVTPRFTSYSPTRHTLRAQGTVPVTQKLDAVLELDYRYSTYSDANQQLDGSFIRRDEDRYRATAKAIHALTPKMDMDATYRYTNNDSTLADKRYTGNQYSLNISYLW